MENVEQKTTAQLVKEILEGSKQSITANIVDSLKKNITDNLTWSLREHVSKVTNEFVETELKEEIVTILKSQKAQILEDMKGAFIKIGAEVATAMYTQAAKNLNTNSYGTKELLKKLLD